MPGKVDFSKSLRLDQQKRLPIASITPFTLQDYPDHTACILWFSGCNMACGYCHNPELAKGSMEKLSFEQVATFLRSRAGFLDGVVLSGGECTLFPALPDLARFLKELGYLVKVDTNGANPRLLQQLLTQGLVNYVALDFKAPRAKWREVTRANNYGDFEKSLTLLCLAQQAGQIALEVRTTVHADLLTVGDIQWIQWQLEEHDFSGTYYLQKFQEGPTLGGLAPSRQCFDPSLLPATTFLRRLRNF